MEFIDISHKRDYPCTINAVSSQQNESCSAFNILKESGYWCSGKNNKNTQEYFILEFQKEVVLDYIELETSPNGLATFPRDFRFEASLDNASWQVIHTEKNAEFEGACYRLDLPLFRVRFLKLAILASRKNEGKYYSEIGNFRGGIAGIKNITASSNLSDKAARNLLFADEAAIWESEANPAPKKETLLIDLGKIFHINRIVLGSASHGFPDYFSIQASADNNLWLPLLEEKDFRSQEDKKYFWNTDIVPAQYLLIEAMGAKYPDGSYGVRLASLEISAAPFNPYHTHNVGSLAPHASVFQAGLVRLAKDSEDTPGIAVQANDRRLRDAGTLFKGIVRLAEDGDTHSELAVQASDSRLKPSTEQTLGIVRLAYDRETKPGAAVQGSDSRLKEADLDHFGIVKLCPDGMYKENAVVTGNDSRLKKATEQAFGISKLAPNGDDTQGLAVQANDKRLRSATTSFKGIVELAEDGEDSAGVAIQGNDRRLKEATTITKGIVELAEDGEESMGVAVQGNDRRLKDATETTKGIVELAEDGEESAGVVIQGNDRRLKDATTSAKGIVILSKDGENKDGAAVQGNDRRLKDATTSAKGIVELAEDGENSAGVAVQGNDWRLKDATTKMKGIVELAEDGEDSAAVAVQGNDRRLKNAAESSKGIVQLAKNGQDSKGVAVQGNDRRLKDATTSAKGIVELAEDGEAKGGVAVQGNDRRLKDATTRMKGIVELAEDGENQSGVAVQGNDRRLKDATTKTKGIVELAEDGENKSGVAVQGNDRRLMTATENAAGIVRLAKGGESKPGWAVQSNDERLSDARSPLPHDHDYAPSSHDFNSHSGTISVRSAKHEKISGVTPPSEDSAVIYAKNESVDSGSVGIAGISGISASGETHSYGIVGHAPYIGVRGQSSGLPDGDARGCGVMGISRFGAGGVFASEHDFSLYVDGFGALDRYDKSLQLAGNGDALCVNGKSVFNGTVNIANPLDADSNAVPANIVELFEVDEAEYISAGDLLIASPSGKSVLSRSRSEYSRGAIGVVSGNPVVIINNCGREKKVYPVALAGKVLCKVDARNSPVRPGDLIVTSNTPGCGMAGNIDSFEKIGTVIGKSLDTLEDGIGLIPVFVSHR